jgi:hypothetical protein
VSFTPPASFAEKLELPQLGEILKNLLHTDGKEFEKTVRTAFNFLDFDASLTESTQSEADVIAEAYYAENPYFIVIECQAVLSHNQVGVDKVGQIRGSAEAYSLDPRRQQLFRTSHKLIVGRPEFSPDARKRSHPDVGLITATHLGRLLISHRSHLYSQDELKEVLCISGEITDAQIDSFQQRILGKIQYPRKLDIYSLIYLGLLEDPISDNLEKRKDWVSMDNLIGVVLTYGSLFRIPNLSKEEIAEGVRDLDNPFLSVLRRRINVQSQVEVRLSSISRPIIQTSSQFGKELSIRIGFFIDKLRTIARSGQTTN